jgi:hypothetical protein
MAVSRQQTAMKTKVTCYCQTARHKKPSPGKVRARVGLVGADADGLPGGESILQLYR